MANPQSPGWYDDPQNPEQLRYFDGIIWTDHTTPRSTRAMGVQPTQAQAQAPGSVPPVPPAPGTAQPGQGQWGQQPEQGQWGQQPTPSPYGYAPAPPAWQSTPTGPTTADGEPLAGWFQRVGAVIIDGIITSLLTAVFAGYFYYQAVKPLIDEFAKAFESSDPEATTTRLEAITADIYAYMDIRQLVIAIVIATIVSLVYHIWFHGSRGQTPGKMALGIMVRPVDRPGPPGFRVAAVREVLPVGFNLLGNVPLVGNLASLGTLINYLWPLWDPKRQALHDKLARTQVVVKRR